MSKSTGNGKADQARAWKRIKEAENGVGQWGVDVRYRTGDDIRVIMLRSLVNKCRGKVFGGSAKADMGDRFGELVKPYSDGPRNEFGERDRTRNKASGWKGGYDGTVWGAIIGVRAGGTYFGVNLRADISPEDMVQIIIADRMVPRIKRGEKFILCPDGIGSVPPEQGDEHYPNGFWDTPIPTGTNNPETGHPEYNFGNLFRGWKSAACKGVREWYGESEVSGDRRTNTRTGGGENKQTNKRIGKGPVSESVGLVDADIVGARDILDSLGAELNDTMKDILHTYAMNPGEATAMELGKRHGMGVATVYRNLSAIRERAAKLVGSK